MEWGIFIAAISVSGTLVMMLAAINAGQNEEPVTLPHTSNEENERSYRAAA